MVRLKSLPEKSLYFVDYSDPSVVFWFFGQAPSNTKVSNHSTNTSTNTNTHATRGQQAKNNNSTNTLSSVPTNSTTTTNTGTPSTSTGTTLGKHHNNHNHTNGSSSSSHETNNSSSKRASKGSGTSNNTISLPPPPITNQNGSQWIALPSPTSSPVSSSGVVSPPPTGHQAFDSSSSLSSHGHSKNQETDKITKAETVHPLSHFSEVPALTDLQIFITEAMLGEEDHSCSFEKIYEYVSQRWRNIRRRDGSNYTTDCRRAIQANLRHNPNHIALFRKDKTKEGSYWTVCNTLEESAEASRDRTSERRFSRRDREIETNDSKAEEDTNGAINSEEDEKTKGTEDTKLKVEIGISSVPTTPTDSSPKENEVSSPTLETKAAELPKLTELQALVCDCINDNAGSCHFDLIVHHVSKHWNTIANKNGNSDVKSAILSTLTDSKRLFKRDTKRTGWWMINDMLSDKSKKEEDTKSTPKGKRATRSTKDPESVSSPEPIEESTSVADNSDANSGSGDESQKQKNDPPMTELQILIIQAIDKEGGVASFDQIYDRVSKKFDSIKRRDGTPYTSECRRAIQASLSNNPATRPFFKKETKKGTVLWSLAKRSVEFLAEYRQNDLDDPKPTETEEDKAVDNAEDHQNESEEADEEIHDEELDEDEETKLKPEKEEDKQKEDTKEERHLYANRVKRARKIKENAGKRNQSPDTKTEKELRFKKRRR